MRILHTSDWHLGNRLMEQSRQAEFAAFLDWLLATMREHQVDALLVCGDVFDSTTPSDRARELYCDFLSRADATGCRATIITAGNHDSALHLRATAPLLARHHAHVVPSLRVEEAASCLIPLHDTAGQEAALVAAVPFLRAAEVARRVPAEDATARASAYVDGIADVYAEVAEAVRSWKAASSARASLPVIALGHLSLGGATATGSTRPVAIGSVEAVNSGIFDPVFDYVALGHLHQPSAHGGGRLRYCGSPLPMGFDEAALRHEVLLVELSPARCEVTPLPVPRFALYEEATCATAAEVNSLLSRLKKEAETAHHANSTTPLPVWLKLCYSGADMSLRELGALLDSRAEDCHLRSFRTMRPENDLPTFAHENEDAGNAPSLQEMEPHQLFTRRLAEWSASLGTPVREEDQQLLTKLFAEVAAEAEAEQHA